MVAENSPLLLAVTDSSKRFVSNVIATGAPGTNPLPVTVTTLPEGPDDGLSEMDGLLEPEVLKFHSQLSSTPLEAKQSKKLPF